jgi:hypothetical protein
MKSHAFVRENVPRAILYGQIQSKEGRLLPAYFSFDQLVSLVVATAESLNTKLDDSFSGPKAFAPPHTPCPAFSKFLYFLFAPTLIYRDSYPRTSSVQWKYVLSQLAQFVGSAFFGYYLFYRFCLPVFRHFKSDYVTVKIFVLSILNCTLPGALLLFCGWCHHIVLMEHMSLCYSFLWFSPLLAQCICGNASFWRSTVLQCTHIHLPHSSLSLCLLGLVDSYFMEQLLSDMEHRQL